MADRLAEADVRDVAIHVDVWRSLNGRFQQRMVDPRVDLLEAQWSPFKPTEWIMPLLVQLTPWRDKLARIEKEVMDRNGSKGTASVVFVADFPGTSVLFSPTIEESCSNEWTASVASCVINLGPVVLDHNEE